MNIIPTLLCQSEEEFAAGLQRFEPVADTVQIDFADGVFVPNTLVGPAVVNQFTTPLRFECHLMVHDPLEWVRPLLSNEQTMTIVAHVESDGFDLEELAGLVRSADRRLGIALRPETAVASVVPYLPQVDQVLILCVEPGFNGSPFLPEMVEKVAELRQLWPDGLIEVDGGMSPETIGQVAAAGADLAAVGSFLRQGDMRQRLHQLQTAADQHT